MILVQNLRSFAGFQNSYLRCFTTSAMGENKKEPLKAALCD